MQKMEMLCLASNNDLKKSDHYIKQVLLYLIIKMKLTKDRWLVYLESTYLISLQ